MGSFLLVEGKEDQHVMYAICQAKNIPQEFSIKELGGVDNLLDSIPVYVKSNERIAIVIDADLDVSARWQQLRSKLISLGFSLPLEPQINGYMGENSFGQTVGVWVMPNNKLPGMMEDFLTYLVPDDDTLMEHVNTFISSLPEDSHRFKDVHLAKARIYAYLSVKDEPGKPLGQSITKRNLDPNTEACNIFTKWIIETLIAKA